MSFLQRRRARFLIKRAQGLADEPLVAVANFTWVGNSMAAQPGVRGRGEWAGGLPDWTLIAAGANRLFVIAPQSRAARQGHRADWQLAYPREAGPVPLGAWRAIRFEFPDREPAVLQPFGREVDDLLQAHRAAQPTDSQHGVRWEALAEVALMTTSGGPFEEDVFFVLTYEDGPNSAVPLGEAAELLPRLQELPGFDNETYIQAMAVSEEGISWLWRR
jgi:hypothetical protein